MVFQCEEVVVAIPTAKSSRTLTWDTIRAARGLQMVIVEYKCPLVCLLQYLKLPFHNHLLKSIERAKRFSPSIGIHLLGLQDLSWLGMPSGLDSSLLDKVQKAVMKITAASRRTE